MKDIQEIDLRQTDDYETIGRCLILIGLVKGMFRICIRSIKKL